MRLCGVACAETVSYHYCDLTGTAVSNTEYAASPLEIWRRSTLVGTAITGAETNPADDAGQGPIPYSADDYDSAS